MYADFLNFSKNIVLKSPKFKTIQLYYKDKCSKTGS